MTLLSCGIDSEKFPRFIPIAAQRGYPFPFVFSCREIDHCRGLSDPAQGLCAAFCFKEAMRKALAAPYNYPDCEALFDDRSRTLSIFLAANVTQEFGVGRIFAEVMRSPLDSKELIVAVSVFG